MRNIVFSFLKVLFLGALLIPSNAWPQCSTCSQDLSFTANPEYTGPYAIASQVDVNRGNSPATFVTAAYWQIYGSAPSPATVTQQVNNLTTLPYWRRIDVVNTFMSASGRTIPRVYSEPWQSEPQSLNPPCKNLARDIGAVCMFFFSCPGGTNCGMDWANTHVEGMSSPSTLLAYGANSTGAYTSSSNAGFWERELLDARYAGLSYLLPNVYGPDLSDGSIANLASALATVNSMGMTGQVKIGLFDDTSGWNNNGDFPFAPWNNSLWTSAGMLDGYGTAQINNAASIIYQNKWKAFFSQIPSQYWYEVNGHPLIYMYYGGTIPVDGSSQPIIAAIVAQIKNLFQADFGVTPYVVIDIGFSYGQATVADNQFVWNTLQSPYVTNYISTYTNAGITADLAMVKWDPLGRDDGGSNAVATNYSGGYSSANGVIKDDSYLKAALSSTTSATFLTLATWNDLGEGTGLNRCYDYYVNGQWMPPDYFMKDIRHSQSQVTCAATNTPTNTVTGPQSPTATPTMTMTNTATFTFTPTSTPFSAACNGSVMTLNGVLNESVWSLDTNSLIPNANCNYGTGCGTTDASASAQFKAAWNSTGLWLGVTVSDSGTLYADSAAPWNGSGVEVFLDLNNIRGGYNSGTGNYNDANTYQWSITYNASAIAQYHNATTRTIQAASVATAGTGYVMEIEIPWSALGTTAPTAGSLSGLDVAVDVSNAAGTARDHQIVAVNGSYNPYDQTPAQWGTLQYQTCVAASNTPTASMTSTFSMTPTMTSSASPTVSNTQTLTSTKTSTSTSTSASTATSTATVTLSPTSSNTPLTPVNTATPTNSQTATVSSTFTRTSTVTVTLTSTATLANSATNTVTLTPVPPTATFTVSMTRTSTNTSTVTQTVTQSSTPTFTPTATFSSTSTFTRVPTSTCTNTSTPTVSNTATFSATRTHTGTPTLTATPTGNVNAVPVVYPNPVTGGSFHIHLYLPAPANVTVELYSLSFRKIREQVFIQQPVGVDMVVDLLDKSGMPLANGLYYVSVASTLSTEHKIAKLLVLR